MHIEADAKTIKSQQPYRTSPRKRKLIREAVAQLKELDVIEPSSSEVASPVVVVIQKGKPRFCIEKWIRRLSLTDTPYQNKIRYFVHWWEQSIFQLSTQIRAIINSAWREAVVITQLSWLKMASMNSKECHSQECHSGSKTQLRTSAGCLHNSFNRLSEVRNAANIITHLKTESLQKNRLCWITVFEEKLVHRHTLWDLDLWETLFTPVATYLPEFIWS